jgi:hypothetical protein
LSGCKIYWFVKQYFNCIRRCGCYCLYNGWSYIGNEWLYLDVIEKMALEKCSGTLPYKYSKKEDVINVASAAEPSVT